MELLVARERQHWSAKTTNCFKTHLKFPKSLTGKHSARDWEHLDLKYPQVTHLYDTKHHYDHEA